MPAIGVQMTAAHDLLCTESALVCYLSSAQVVLALKDYINLLTGEW